MTEEASNYKEPDTSRYRVQVYQHDIETYALHALALMQKGQLPQARFYEIIYAVLNSGRTDLLDPFLQLDPELVNKPINSVGSMAGGNTSMLTLAATWANVELVKHLLDKKADPNLIVQIYPVDGSDSRSPLAAAVRTPSEYSEEIATKHLEVTKLLIAAGAAVTDEVIELAQRSGHYRLKLAPGETIPKEHSRYNPSIKYVIDKENSYGPKIYNALLEAQGKEPVEPVLHSHTALTSHIMGYEIDTYAGFAFRNEKFILSDSEKKGNLLERGDTQKFRDANVKSMRIIFGLEPGKGSAVIPDQPSNPISTLIHEATAHYVLSREEIGLVAGLALAVGTRAAGVSYR